MSLSSLFLVFLIFSVAYAIPGGWEPIPDLNAPEVKDAAKFAVSEHKKLGKTRLGFESVESGDWQVVSGMNYRLVIAAKDGDEDGKDGDEDGNYEAVVYVKAWAHFKSLTSFKKLDA